MDFESLDGRQVVDAKLGAQGVRDLHGALMHLAILLEQEPTLERAFLIIRFPRLRLESAQEAWTRARDLLRPDIAARLAVIVLAPNSLEPWFDPDDMTVREVAHTLAFRIGGIADQPLPKQSVSPTSAKFFEFWKVLLHGWLRRTRPSRLQQVAEIAGCSHQTAIRSLALLERRGELLSHARDTTHVALRAFPRVTFEQAVGLGAGLRRTRWFVDESGRTPDPIALLRRLEKCPRPDNVAIGGVIGARVLDPEFDLHGTPRVDLTIWAPDGGPPYDASFISDVDPGLRESHGKDNAVLAVHRLARAQPLFQLRNGALPCADPVEVLLDLHEIALDVQAAQLVSVLRDRAQHETQGH